MSGASLVVQQSRISLQCRRCGFEPGSGRSPGEGSGNLLQYSCLENATDRGAWWVTVHRVVRIGHDLATKHTRTA